MERTLLLVTGAGRSGTSTVAGALSLLGVNVPGPYLAANASNPRGFYESKWSVDFHNKLLKRAAVSIADGRPDAQEKLLTAVRDTDRAGLRDTLTELTAGHDVTALKDPRTVWTLSLWREVADELGIRLATVTMLRHPAEVLGSRATHYSAGVELMGEQGYAVRNLAGWTNAMLMTERGTRDWTRSFVRYDDLLADWRAALNEALTELGVETPGPEPHPVDDFVDPQLSRHRLSWSDVPVPFELQQVAEAVWSGCSRLAGRPDPEGEQAVQELLDEARKTYDAMYLAARQLVHDATAAEVTLAKRKATRSKKKQAATQQTPQRLPQRIKNKLRRNAG